MITFLNGFWQQSFEFPIQAIAIEDLENGDRAKAMKRLRVPPLSERVSNVDSLESAKVGDR